MHCLITVGGDISTNDVLPDSPASNHI